jgi:hypothetical protein
VSPQKVDPTATTITTGVVTDSVLKSLYWADASGTSLGTSGTDYGCYENI